jgi:hypothetical protein
VPSRGRPSGIDGEESRKPVVRTVAIGAVLLVLVLLVWLFFGGSREAYISGKVTLETEPVAHAEVVFVGEAEENRAPLVAITNEQGEYKLTGHQSGGIPHGAYKVTVAKMALKDGTLPKGERLEEARESGLLRNMLPPVYADPERTPLRFEIHAGDNTVNLPLKNQP